MFAAFIIQSVFPNSTINSAYINNPMYSSFWESQPCIWGSEQQGLKTVNFFLTAAPPYPLKTKLVNTRTHPTRLF